MSLEINTNPVTYSTAATQTTGSDTQSTAAATAQAAQTEEKAYEVEKSTEQEKKFVTDYNKINSIKAGYRNNFAAFQKMVSALFQTQGNTASTALIDLNDLANNTDLKDKIAALNVDQATIDEAKALIGEDGYWGVEQTANRILDFAKALSGGDPSKISLLKDAVEKGFEQAAGVWGDELPEISQKTYDRIMEGFDEWENGGATVAEDEE